MNPIGLLNVIGVLVAHRLGRRTLDQRSIVGSIPGYSGFSRVINSLLTYLRLMNLVISNLVLFRKPQQAPQQSK